MKSAVRTTQAFQTSHVSLVFRSRNKYNARKTGVHDSGAEAEYLRNLKLLEKTGYIFDLKIKPELALTVNGVRIGKYTPEASYIRKEDNGLTTVDDVKGYYAKAEAASLRTRIASACYPDVLFRWVDKHGFPVRLYKAGKLSKPQRSAPKKERYAAKTKKRIPGT